MIFHSYVNVYQRVIQNRDKTMEPTIRWLPFTAKFWEIIKDNVFQCRPSCVLQDVHFKCLVFPSLVGENVNLGWWDPENFLKNHSYCSLTVTSSHQIFGFISSHSFLWFHLTPHGFLKSPPQTYSIGVGPQNWTWSSPFSPPPS